MILGKVDVYKKLKEDTVYKNIQKKLIKMEKISVFNTYTEWTMVGFVDQPSNSQ